MSTPRSLLLLALLVPVLAAQPMSGNYTIDNSAPTGGANYASLLVAAQDLMLRGVGGPVLFSVLPGNGPYGGFHLGPVAGTSAINTITFRGVGYPVVQGGFGVSTPKAYFQHTIHLYATTYNGLGPYLLGTGPSHVTLEGIEVTNGLGNGYGAIVGMGCTNLTLRDCRIHDSDAAVTVGFSPATVVEGCDVWNISPPAPFSFAGKFAAVGIAALCDDSVLRGNRIHDCVQVGVYIGGQLNTSTGVAFTPSLNMTCANNMMWNVSGRAASATSPWAVLVVYGAPGAVVANNSITVPPWPGGAGAGDGLQLGTTSAPGFVVNNVVKNNGDGACVAFASIPTAPPAVLDFNLYEVGPSASVGAINATTYSSLGSWQAATGQEASSIAAPAGFLSATDLHIAHTSAALQIAGTPLTQVTADIDGNPRHPMSPCRGADEFVLSLRGQQPGGPGSGITLRNLSLIPGNEYYNIISLQPCAAGAGPGPYLGLCATPAELQGLIAQLLLPVGAVPFHFIATSTTTTFGPYPVGPLTLEGVCFDFTGGVIGSVSAVERITIL